MQQCGTGNKSVDVSLNCIEGQQSRVPHIATILLHHLTLLLTDGGGRGWVCGVATGREVEMTENSEHLFHTVFIMAN